MDDYVVDRGVSRYGLHMVHVMGAQAVDVEAWVAREKPEEAEYWTLAYREEELGIWHLFLWWKEKGAEYEWIR